MGAEEELHAAFLPLCSFPAHSVHPALFVLSVLVGSCSVCVVVVQEVQLLLTGVVEQRDRSSQGPWVAVLSSCLHQLKLLDQEGVLRNHLPDGLS